MNQDKLKVYLLLAFMGVVCSIVLLIVLDTYVPIDPGGSYLRKSQIPVRATATSFPSTITLTPSSLSSSTPTITLSPYPTRIEDATSIPTPIFIPINPPYSP